MQMITTANEFRSWIFYSSLSLKDTFFQCHEPEDGVFFAQIGPTGGEQGYASITGKFWRPNNNILKLMTVLWMPQSCSVN